jgi:hypothetical protein
LDRSPDSEILAQRYPSEGFAPLENHDLWLCGSACVAEFGGGGKGSFKRLTSLFGSKERKSRCMSNCFGFDREMYSCGVFYLILTAGNKATVDIGGPFFRRTSY